MSVSGESFFYNFLSEILGNGPEAAILSAFLGIMLVFVLIMAAVGIVSYIMGSIGIFTMAKRRGIKHYGLAWVPYIDAYMVGCLADQYDRKEHGRDIPTRKFLLIAGIILLVLEVVLCVVSVIVLGNTIELAFYANNEMMLEQLIETYAAIYIPAMLLNMLSIAYSVFMYIALYKVYKSCKPSGVVVLLVMSILFSIIVPFVLFALRKKDDGYVMLNQARECGGQQDNA